MKNISSPRLVRSAQALLLSLGKLICSLALVSTVIYLGTTDFAASITNLSAIEARIEGFSKFLNETKNSIFSVKLSKPEEAKSWITPASSAPPKEMSPIHLGNNN